ncbi:RND superfamily permease [Halobacterium hubeiense]|uniref:RND superfamily permease n=1 Tax=Halobacterium hubeiense TaxID=1407499 RepID=A0A0U5H522_9EURY|nr:MMPL family transporter [Halobacterium hubeiense]CQH58333.1 RND superfamily permease [Halobacterium hubeiense]
MAGVSRIGDAAAFVTNHSKAIIAVMLVLTVLIGAGAGDVQQSSSLDQFQTESDESQKLDYIESNFSSGAENATTVQVVVRDDNVLTKDALVGTLEYERALYDNETVNETLADDGAITGIANVVATASIQQEEGRELQATLQEFEQLNETVQSERATLEQRSAALNATAESLRAELTVLRQNPDASVEAAFDRVRANSSVNLTDSHYATFERAASDLRSAQSQSEVEAAYRLGTRGVLEAEYAALEERSNELESQAQRLQTLGEELQTQRATYENASNATLDEQLAQLQSLNDSEVESLVATVLGGGQNGGNGQSVFGLMPTSYEPGSTTAEATMLVATQQTDSEAPAGGPTGSETIVDAQLAMQDLGDDRAQEFLVFGGGIITHEIDSSMTDSLLIVGPLAILFVLVALAVAYRDVLDILLGLFGIGAVLAWTFGFMGLADISFNQIMIAVPVLLIGLSIDYAIHIFMRHREERLGAVDDPDRPADPRGSMRVALAGVGVALVWVTATTVIGFLSNLTSPVPPIGDFGVVSSVGIVAALLVFGVLIPAMKVELDAFLESRGWDRKKRAFGTGGGRFSEVLSFGSKAARKAPAIVLVLTLLVTAAGAYGATNVDTSFNQQDFLAEDPADWMKDLPEPFAPGEYTAKANLEYVNDRFSPENSQAQILIEGDVASDRSLERIQAARDAAAEQNVTYTLANGEPGVQGPLSTMQAVAASNESFNETFHAADTDGNGVPDRNVEAVYDALYETAPEQAGSYIHQTDDGDYAAARLVVSTQGGASGGEVTEQMRDVADVAAGDGLEATATGSAILNKIVQDQLLDTVIQSLLVTLVAVFAFLMATYRLTDGSATLGAVTLLPVVLSVAWILGTMYVFGIPFNVLTGMITSLTVGLGVAYSIHLSERYMQELERTDTVWEAMRTAVTGTGGALLGSAATTVGGFGVLVFAILPPLQQFGIITGLTIVYAFLAAVLVLPTLLVLWTKYLGPEDANFGGDGDDPDPPADDGDDPSTTASAEPVVDAETAPAAAATADAGADEPTRTLSRDLVQPGGTLTATVTVPARDGRVVLTETVRGGTVVDLDTDPEPVEAVADDDTVYVAWRLDGEHASASYEVSVAETAPDGSEVELSGRVLADGDERTIAGDDGAAVVADIFERVFAQADVTDDDLAEASAAFADGELTADQYDRVVREWARERPEGE